MTRCDSQCHTASITVSQLAEKQPFPSWSDRADFLATLKSDSDGFQSPEALTCALKYVVLGQSPASVYAIDAVGSFLTNLSRLLMMMHVDSIRNSNLHCRVFVRLRMTKMDNRATMPDIAVVKMTTGPRPCEP